MKVVKIRTGVLAAMATFALLGAGVTTAQACKTPVQKVTLCHRTGSQAGGNTHAGYSIITVNISSVANAKSVRGHDGHNKVGNGPFGDIIPSYTYLSYTYPGKNLTNGGAEFLANGCKGVTAPPVTTTKPCPPKTTPPVTTTTKPATTPPETTTSTTKPPKTTTPPVTTTAPVEVESTTATTTAAPPVAVLSAAASQNPLPVGAAAGEANTGSLIGGGLTGLTAMLALGAGFILRRRHGVS